MKGENMKEFKELILKGKFDQAYELCKKLSMKEIEEYLISISFDSKNMLVYGFVSYALLKKETIPFHLIAIQLLTNSYVVMEGASDLAYCHAKRALEIDPSSILALSEIMFLSGDPNTNGTRQDFEFAKERMAELCPNDPILKMEYGHSISPEEWKKSKVFKLYENLAVIC